MRKKFLIIGAGPTGLGAAYRLKESGEDDYLILEKNNYVGGLAASFLDKNGFTWDIGGHVQFSHYKYFDDVMSRAIDESGWLHHERESWVWIQDRFVPYPFQNNIRYLPRDTMWACLKGLVELATAEKKNLKPANFAEWIEASFGRGVADVFMLPYNYKVWAFPPEELSYEWIGDRVATVNLEKILENIIYDRMDASWGPNNTFHFPLEGGTGAIWNSVGNLVGRDRIRLGASVATVDHKERSVTLADGEKIEYENLLSTMPLDIFVSMIDGLQPSLKKYVSGLKHSSSNIIGIGVRGKAPESLQSKCWMYFPESNTPFYRVTMFSKYSPRNVPGDEFHSFMCEVSESPSKPVKRDQVVHQTVEGLKTIGFLKSENDVVSRWSFSADYGYPTPSLERNQILSETIPLLDEIETFSRGRFGGWKYEVSNQDHSFMQGVEWVNRIISQESEQTYRVDDNSDPNMTILKGKKAA